MSLSNASGDIIAAVVGAGLSGTIAGFIAWRQTRSPVRKRKVTNAWQKQAQELTDELRRQHAASEAWLKTQLANCDTGRQKDRREAQQEIARLNKLLTERGRP